MLPCISCVELIQKPLKGCDPPKLMFSDVFPPRGLKTMEATSTVFLVVGADISAGETMKPSGRSPFGMVKGDDL